jgi:hypothetical protein
MVLGIVKLFRVENYQIEIESICVTKWQRVIPREVWEESVASFPV